MPARAWVLALSLMLSLTLAGCSAATSPAGTGASRAGSTGAGLGFRGLRPPASRRPAPAVVGALLGGGRLSLVAWRGHPVLVNFWASWCGPCQQETPALQRAYLATRGAGVHFLGVAVADQRDAAQRFRATHRVGYPSLFDPSGGLLARFHLPSGLPDSVLIDRQGRVAGVWIGAVAGPRLVTVLRGLAGAAPQG